MADPIIFFGGQVLNPFISNPTPQDPTTIPGFVGDIFDLGVSIFTGRSPGLPQLPPAPGGTLPGLPPPGTGGFTLGGAIPAGSLACATDACCRGFHLNKSRGCDGSPAGTKCVKNRRMNPLNPKALKRAIRRATRFESFVKSNRKSLRKLAKI